MIKVISHTICPFVQRVTALLEAKRLPYEIEYIQLSNKPQWFLDISPTAQVPILLTETGEALFESDAIVEYLEEVTAPLVEGITPVQRARERAWSYQASKHYLMQCSTLQSPDKNTFLARSEKLNKAFDKAEKQLGEGLYFNGEAMGNVDIAWLPLLHRAGIIKQKSGYDLLADYPKVQAWQAALGATGIAEKSVAKDFEEVFSRFYLSTKTFLGRGANFDENPCDAATTQAPVGCCA